MRFLSTPRFLLLAVGGTLVLHYAGILRPAEYGIATLLRPAMRVLSAVEIPQSSTDRAQEALDERLRVLARENASLRDERDRCVTHTDANAFLKAKDLQGVEATVVGRTPGSDGQVLLLDRGKESGIIEGAPVIADGVLVATITMAENGRSTARLLTDAASDVSAEVADEHLSMGILSGSHGLTLSLQYLPVDAIFTAGMLVHSGTATALVPPNIPIGEITEVQTTPGALFQTATVRPLYDVRRLRYISVVLPTTP